jgi:hypothetical protein
MESIVLVQAFRLLNKFNLRLRVSARISLAFPDQKQKLQPFGCSTNVAGSSVTLGIDS